MHSAVLLILVVEDDSLIQDLVDAALAEGGFENEIVASGEKAVALLQGAPTRYRALLTDINLKGQLTGWDVAKRARELNPEMPVIYMTGAAADEWPSHGVPNSILLNKPFAPAQVVTAVSQLINQAPQPKEYGRLSSRNLSFNQRKFPLLALRVIQLRCRIWLLWCIAYCGKRSARQVHAFTA